MRRLLLPVLVLLGAIGVLAQPDLPQPGEPPVLEHITVSPPSATGTVTISGAAGAVFPNAYVAVRSLYTGSTAFARAGITGSFSVEIDGVENTPYWISPSEEQITGDMQREAESITGSLPGGPGVIVYSPFAEAPPTAQPITQIAIDGDLSDWDAYPDAVRVENEGRSIAALRNADSLFVALSGDYTRRPYTSLEVRFTVDTNSYTVTFDPRQAAPAVLARVNPSARDLGTLNIASRQVMGIEMRIPLSFLSRADHLTLDRVRTYNGDGAEVLSDTTGTEIPPRDEITDIFRVQSGVTSGATPFSLASPAWTARGRVESLALTPGARWHVEMNVDFLTPDLPADAEMVGTLALLPVAREADGELRVVGGAASNSGWSSILTVSGMPIDNLLSRTALGEASAKPYQLIRQTAGVRLPLDFAVTVPRDLPTGLYVPVFTGFTENPDGTRAAWDAEAMRLPLVVNVGDAADARLLWTLFADNPSDGSRGVLPAEDADYAAISNRVRFNSPTYILPPFQPGTRTPVDYPLEPYLLNQLSNNYTTGSAPLIPFRFPSGRIQATVVRPDGTVDDLGSAAVAQNQLSTPAEDERVLFGVQSPLDEYRLTTLDSKFSAYHFDQYGEYTITLTGSLSDVWGNRYAGGGTYRILAADLLDLTPGVLPGTPFEVGDSLNFAAHVSPGFSAEVTVTVRVYPLDGSATIERSVRGTANATGYFQPNNVPFAFAKPGEYIIDYEARYRAADGRLWAASLRSAGVIAGADSTLVAHGARGVPDIDSTVRPAWFDASEYADATASSSVPGQLYYPYYSGDVAWIGDGRGGGIVPVIRVQDLGLQADGQPGSLGAYEQELAAELPGYVGDGGRSIYQVINEDEMPVIAGGSALRDNVGGYTYISAVRPNVTVRQFVSGGDGGGLPLGWDNDDPLNRQIGAGIGGNRPGDMIFLFGGAIVRAGDLRASAIYGALAMITDADEPPRIYPPDRGAAGSADGGPLLTVNDQPVDTFIVLTGVQPGEVLRMGDTIAIGGQVAPPLPANVTTTLTTPSGRVYRFGGEANAVGYYYSPANRLLVDEPGVWMVSIEVEQAGNTSAGEIEAPAARGGVIGANGGSFPIYVVPRDAVPLPWNPLLTDSIIPIVSPYNFNFILPEDWSQMNAYYTLTTPGYIIEDGQLRINGRNFTYQYTAPLQSRAFPNLENDGRSGSYIADGRTLTFVATGIDASGEFQIRSRTFTLMHDRLITTE